MQKIQGWAEQGNTIVYTSNLPSVTKVQGSFPSCTVLVTLTGTGGTHAMLYSDDNAIPTPLANPFTASADGSWGFYTGASKVDITFSGGGLSAPFTLSDVGAQGETLIPSYAYAQLPTTKTQDAGTLARLTDRTRGIWMSNGAQWFGTNELRFNIKEFGALGDGATDDVTAINAAIVVANALGGGIVVAPAGTYIVGSSIILRSSISLIGAGITATTFKLKNGANTDVMATLTPVDTYIDTGNATVGEHYIRLAHFGIDGNKANNASGRGLACYWYKPTVQNVSIGNCKGQGIYEGWGSFGTLASIQDESGTYDDVTIYSCDTANDQWYHSGPHDSKFVNCIVGLGIGKSNLRTGPYGTGSMFTNCHTFGDVGVRQPQWSVIFEGQGCMWNNSTAEGGSIGQILLRAYGPVITGGSQYNIVPAANQLGIQIGDTVNGFTNITGYNIKTSMFNFTNGTVAFDSDGGLGTIEILGFNTNPSILYTGTPSPTSVVELYVTGFGGYLSQHPTPTVFGPGPSFIVNGISHQLNAVGDLTFGAASFSRFINSATGAQITIMKSRATLPNQHTIVQNGDVLGQFVFVGDDGVDYESAGAAIVANVDDVPGAGDIPGRISFWTSPSGSNVLVERMAIDSKGNIRIGKNSLPTNATDGFGYIPTCAGVPTGVPTAYGGWAPLIIDTTNSQLYFYSNGAWRNAGP